MPNIDKPTLYMLMSTLSLSVTGLIAKQLSSLMPIELFSFLRFAIPATIILLLLRMTNIKWPNRNDIQPLIVRASCIALCQLCFLRSMQTLSLVESVVLFATGPLFLPIIERIFYKTSISLITIGSLLVTFTGVMLLSGQNGNIEWRLDLLFGLAGGLFNSGSQLALYRSTKSELTPKQINFWSFSFAALLLIPVVLFHYMAVSHEQYQQSISLQPQAITLLLFMSVMIIYTQVNRAKAYKLANSGSELAPLIFTNLLFTGVWQYVFFNERFSVYQLLGLGLIIIASVGNVLLPKMLDSKRTAKLTPRH